MLAQRKTLTNQPECLLPPPGKCYVRTFLFSRRIDAPFARVHLFARVLFVLCLSGTQLRAIDAAQPDPVGAALLSLLSLLVFLLSGLPPRVARLYCLLMLPALLSLFSTWLLFNPVAGKVTLLLLPLYSGQLHLPFLHPLALLITDRGLLVAITKVIGYSGMLLATFALLTSSRESEFLGALRQLHLPQTAIFFLSIVVRTFDLALADYVTISQAQQARAIAARPRSILTRLRDLASMAVPLVAMMMRRASEISDALWARGYRSYASAQANTNFYETRPWQAIDSILLIVCFCLLYLTFGPRLNLTLLVQGVL